MLHQQALATISQRHRKKIASTLDEIAPVFGHGLMSGVVGGFDGLRYAPPILRELAYAIKNGLA
jgi:hypothetical protein